MKKIMLVLVAIAFLYSCGGDEEEKVRVKELKYTLTKKILEAGKSAKVAIAVDSNDIPFVFFRNDMSEMKYYTQSGDSWVDYTFNLNGLYEFTSLQMDDNNIIHIIDSNSSVKYITNINGTWEMESLGTGSQRSFASIDIDQYNNIHIVYNDMDNNILKYITNKSGAWVTENVVSGANKKGHARLKVGSDGNIHIAYIDIDETAAKYVTNKTGTWVVETLASDMYSGEYDIYSMEDDYISIALDSNNYVHMVAYHYDYNQMYYGTNKTGEWVISKPDRDGWNGRFNEIKIDKNDFVHIVYSDQWDGDVKYCTNKNGSWQVIQVEYHEDAQAIDDNSLVLDSNGNIHIVYNFFYLDESGSGYRDIRYVKIEFTE